MTQDITQASEPIYSSRIIKASALIPDTKVLLSEWTLTQSVTENLDRLQRENIFGKASRRRVEDVLRIFRQRYFDDPDIGAALVMLAQGGAPAQWLDSLLYFFSAQNDRTLRDTVIEVVHPRKMAGYSDLTVEHVNRHLNEWVTEGKMTTAWNEETAGRVARGIMATLRDFGVLKGAVNKQIAPVFLPTPAFALIAFWLKQRDRSGDRVLQSDDWKLFFLPVEGVERFFIEAHQEHLLSYHAAGSVIRIDFPAETLTDYARFLLEKVG